VARSCGTNGNYFASIDECVPLSIASLPVFSTAYRQSVTCGGGLIATSADLEKLRFCQVVANGLTIQVADGDADFTAVYDIMSVTGLKQRALTVFVC